MNTIEFALRSLRMSLRVENINFFRKQVSYQLKEQDKTDKQLQLEL